jgi:serine phosphatase RsbU (regulator of sigma subunit)
MRRWRLNRLESEVMVALSRSLTIRMAAAAGSMVGTTLILAGMLAVCTAAGAERPEPPLVVAPPLDERTTVRAGWSYHPGDDPAWADPALDDSDWPLVSSYLRDPDSMPGGWPGIGWFRRQVVLAEGLPLTALAVRVEQAGAAEVYLDGRLVVSFGTVSANREEEQPFYPNHFDGLVLEPGVTHVLAVRYSNVNDNVIYGNVRGFQVNLRGVAGAAKAYLGWTLMVTVIPMAFFGAFAALALLHLLLFLFHPQSRENLYFTIFIATVAGSWALGVKLSLTPDTMGAVEVRLLIAALVASILTGLAVVHGLFRRRPDLLTWTIGVAGIVLVVWFWSLPALRPFVIGQVYFVLGYAEMLRVAIIAMRRREPDAWIIAAGMIPKAGLVLVTESMILLFDKSIPSILPNAVANTLLVLAFSVYLSRRTARTSRELEARLIEVEKLSHRAIEQERQAAEERAERRMIEAENHRRASELQEARRLQLAMLPRQVPKIDGIDIAFRMVTATEVGGDYFDFRAATGGTLIAVGDATSHGLHAGMVVAVAKSLFHGVDPDEQPVDVLQRIDAGLQEMQERYASMAAVVIRIGDNQLQIASAAMPPLLILRDGSTEVEEVLLSAVPLGTLTGVSYQQRQLAVAPGDTLLLMSDGLVEAMSPDQQLFGYERVSEHLASLGGATAEEVVDGMLAEVMSFVGGSTPQDDITIVAMVVG